MIYEVFRLLGTHVEDNTRVSFQINFVCSIKDKISTKLRRHVLERRMKEGATKISADEILKSLNQVYEESIQIGVNATDAVEEDGELDADDAAGYECEEVTAAPEPKRASTARQKVKKKTMHKDMWQNPWKLGRLSFDKKDVIAIREEGVRRRTRKSQ